MNEIPKSRTIDWESVRDRIEMDPAIIYLNTGTSGLIPKAVHDAAHALRTELHHNPTRFVWRAMEHRLAESRERLATHLHTSYDRLIFFSNISQAINTFCLSVKIPSGSDILLSDHEYGAMRWAWERAAQRQGWNLITCALPVDAETCGEVVDAVKAAITPKTKLLFLSHVLYTTGMVLPIAEICKLANERGIITFVDGAHAPGMLALDLPAIGANFYASNLHKWFLAPVGVAFLHVSPGSEHHLQPWQVSWGYLDPTASQAGEQANLLHQRNNVGSTPWIQQFEMEGTRDLTPWFVLPLSCDFVESLGYDAISERHFELSELVRESIAGLQGLELCTPNSRKLRGGLTAFRLPREWDGQQLRSRLWDKYQIEVNLIDLNGVQYLRISTHFYNTGKEVERLAVALASMDTVHSRTEEH